MDTLTYPNRVTFTPWEFVPILVLGLVFNHECALAWSAPLVFPLPLDLPAGRQPRETATVAASAVSGGEKVYRCGVAVQDSHLSATC